jgi:acetyl-CoA acetyltransferase
MAGAGTASGAKAADILEVAAVIVAAPVLDQIRRELRRRTGHDVDPAELSELITSSVLRPGARGLARPATVVCGIPVGRMEDLA